VVAVVMLLWYGLMMAVQFRPLAPLAARWDRQDRNQIDAAMMAGQSMPKRSLQAKLARFALGAVVVAIMLPITIPMWRATPALQNALLGYDPG
jgi:hypothetical protein